MDCASKPISKCNGGDDCEDINKEPRRTNLVYNELKLGDKDEWGGYSG